MPRKLASTLGVDEPGPFFINAILSRPDGDPGFLVIDFEPIKEQIVEPKNRSKVGEVLENGAPEQEVPKVEEGGHQAMYQQQALRASAVLQRLPTGDLARVCHVAAREVWSMQGLFHLKCLLLCHA